MKQLFPGAVPPKVRRLLLRMTEVGAIEKFYLAGGTGLALLLEHRRSVDLDFFSRTNRLDFVGRQHLLASLRQSPTWKILEASNGTLQGRVDGIRVSFFWYPEPLVRPLIRHERLHIASLEDIGLMKIGAIIGWGSRKDFVDLYAICQRVPLRKLLMLGRRKFRDVSDFRLQSLKALNFFQDAEQEPPLMMITPVNWDDVKTFFTAEVRQLARTYI